MSVLEAENYTTPIGNILLCDTDTKAILRNNKKNKHQNAVEPY